MFYGRVNELNFTYNGVNARAWIVQKCLSMARMHMRGKKAIALRLLMTNTFSNSARISVEP